MQRFFLSSTASPLLASVVDGSLFDLCSAVFEVDCTLWQDCSPSMQQPSRATATSSKSLWSMEPTPTLATVLQEIQHCNWDAACVSQPDPTQTSTTSAGIDLLHLVHLLHDCILLFILFDWNYNGKETTHRSSINKLSHDTINTVKLLRFEGFFVALGVYHSVRHHDFQGTLLRRWATWKWCVACATSKPMWKRKRRKEAGAKGAQFQGERHFRKNMFFLWHSLIQKPAVVITGKERHMSLCVCLEAWR